jgi:subtilisin family serine protease
VVEKDGTIDPGVEARAIRWAVDNDAQVINLSIGGLRDPLHPIRDTRSSQELAAIEYARSRDVVVVAAVGNGDQAPATPWPYASYPAALPHVLGVGALAQDGSVPSFSNRDPIYNDLTAPGDGILSTFPRALTAERPGCADQGYSDCGTPEYRDAEGTSFAAPQVAAAAALLRSVNPELSADQVTTLLERTAVDEDASDGCRRCAPLRDALSGWGRLDIAAALQAAQSGSIPPPDRYEANDDAGSSAYDVLGARRVLRATIDYWDDQVDVYRVKLRAHRRLAAVLHGPESTNVNLVLWKPGTKTVEGLTAALHSRRATYSAHAGPNQRFSYRARAGGLYYVEVKIATPGAGAYSLRLTKSA